MNLEIKINRLEDIAKKIEDINIRLGDSYRYSEVLYRNLERKLELVESVHYIFIGANKIIDSNNYVLEKKYKKLDSINNELASINRSKASNNEFVDKYIIKLNRNFGILEKKIEILEIIYRDLESNDLFLKNLFTNFMNVK